MWFSLAYRHTLNLHPINPELETQSSHTPHAGSNMIQCRTLNSENPKPERKNANQGVGIITKSSPGVSVVLDFAILYYTILKCIIHIYSTYYTILYYTPCHTILSDTILYYTILCCVVKHAIPYYAARCHTALDYTILYYTTPCYTILYHTILYHEHLL